MKWIQLILAARIVYTQDSNIQTVPMDPNSFPWTTSVDAFNPAPSLAPIEPSDPTLTQLENPFPKELTTFLPPPVPTSTTSLSTTSTLHPTSTATKQSIPIVTTSNQKESSENSNTFLLDPFVFKILVIVGAIILAGIILFIGFKCFISTESKKKHNEPTRADLFVAQQQQKENQTIVEVSEQK